MANSAITRHRLRLTVRGTVQGVGFRPFVHRLAKRYKLAGSVHNAGDGVTIEVEGKNYWIHRFVVCLRDVTELPPLARIDDLQTEPILPTGQTEFTIVDTDRSAVANTYIPPDIAVCDDCARDTHNKQDRRYRYPFTNCTNCGPRYTIIDRIPYDRPFTSMRQFQMCPDCEREYHDPNDRRFHAQPNACPTCGPSLKLFAATGAPQVTDDPISAVRVLLRNGKIIALKGIGGFHLAVDPLNKPAVAELRRRKGRADKPFALMANTVSSIRRFCAVTEDERRLLEDPTRPIVLLPALPDNSIAPSVAPGQRYLGFMLPYTPFHELLFDDSLFALVMTSANLAEEPIVIGNDEAFSRLNTLADYILVHNRDIVQRCDDSVMRISAGHPQIIRRSRGFVPGPILLGHALRRPILAVGAELKSVVGLGRQDSVILSQHIGDLDNPSALRFFTESISHLQSLFQVTPELIACDLHPEYLSTKWARGQDRLPVIGIQHHHAHLVSVLADNKVSDRTIGVILDGTGYGTDGTIWGGEVLIGSAASFERFAWLDPVPMPGGSAAIRTPWRMALSYLQHAFGDDHRKIARELLATVSDSQIDVINRMIARRINAPLTSSCGRLFDGVAALLGVRSEITYDAQAAIELEMAALTDDVAGWPVYVEEAGPIDIRPLIGEIVDRRLKGIAASELSMMFHATVANMFTAAAMAARTKTGITTVALGGGVFHNVLLLRLLCDRLRREKFAVLLSRQVPPNDGGLALGQAVIADAQYKD